MGGNQKRVLIADDAMFMRMILRDILTRLGLDVVEAENGEDAVSKYSETHPDLTVLDIIMPKMDGIEALKNILRSNQGASIIMCSASGQQAKVQEALSLGAKDFIIKPFNPNKVTEVLKRYV